MNVSVSLCAAFLIHNRRLGLPITDPLKTLKRRCHGPFIRAFALSAAALSTSLSPSPSFHPSIDALTTKLDGLAPRFELQAGDIHVLTTPEQFYATLREKILAAETRVFLSSLYIGKEETELVPFPSYPPG